MRTPGIHNLLISRYRMRRTTVVLTLLCLAGCQADRPDPLIPAAALPLDSLGIAIDGTRQGFFMSDTRGGFLLVEPQVPGDSLTLRASWTVDAVEIVHGFSLDAAPGGGLRGTVFPDHAVLHGAGGVTVDIALLETDHALVAIVSGASRVIPSVSAAGGVPSADRHTVTWRNAQSSLTLRAGAAGTCDVRGSVLLSDGDTLLFVYDQNGRSAERARDLFGDIPALLQQRRDRMEKISGTMPIITDNDTLTRALQWARLSVAALLVQAKDTCVVAGLPWDGSTTSPDVAGALTGVGLALGRPAALRSVIRGLFTSQDTVAARQTYGRCASSSIHGERRYKSAELTPVLVREAFAYMGEHNDTALAREMYPAVRRSIEGTRRYHTDAHNFLVHGEHETWMPTVDRGRRAAEVQAAWFYQQQVGELMAMFVDDSAMARVWGAAANTTVNNFNDMFIDSATGSIYDHLDQDDRGVFEDSPAGLLCFDIVSSFATQEANLRSAMKDLIVPMGVTTGPPGGGGAGTNDPLLRGDVATFLSGPAVYMLNMFDREDLAYVLTMSMARQILYGPIAGGIPAFVSPRDGRPTAGQLVSVRSLAEFIRSFVQDYLGYTYDPRATRVSLRPRIPAPLQHIDASIPIDNGNLMLQYSRMETSDRIRIRSPRTMEVVFLWMLRSGGAWRGAVDVPQGRDVMLLMNDDDAVAFRDEESTGLKYVTRLKGFSQRDATADMHFAPPRP